MQIEAKELILVLLGVLQAWFFYDKSRTDAQIKELRTGLKEMIDVTHKIQTDLSIARYALFVEKGNGRKTPDDTK